MGRPSTSPDVLQKIASIWIKDRSLTATQVYHRASNIQGRPSLRKVQQIVRDTKEWNQREGLVMEEPGVVPWLQSGHDLLNMH